MENEPMKVKGENIKSQFISSTKWSGILVQLVFCIMSPLVVKFYREPCLLELMFWIGSIMSFEVFDILKNGLLYMAFFKIGKPKSFTIWSVLELSKVFIASRNSWSFSISLNIGIERIL